MSQFDQIQIAISRLLNTFLLGKYNEMVSSRAYRLRDQYKLWNIIRLILNCIFYWQEDHCKESYDWELNES